MGLSGEKTRLVNKRAKQKHSLTLLPLTQGDTVLWNLASPSPSLHPCTQIVCDNQRTLEGLESIAHEVNEVFNNTQQVHRARRHLGTERMYGSEAGLGHAERRWEAEALTC